MWLSDQTVIWNTRYTPYKVLDQITSNNDELFSTIDISIKNLTVCFGQVQCFRGFYRAEGNSTYFRYPSPGNPPPAANTW